jgi:hypothetical protein
MCFHSFLEQKVKDCWEKWIQAMFALPDQDQRLLSILILPYLFSIFYQRVIFGLLVSFWWFDE